MSISIRPMRPEDAAGKALVHYRSWLETYPGLMPAEYLNGRSLDKCEELARRFPENTLVALDGAQVVGFACYALKARAFVSLRPASELAALYVLKDWQGQGVGSALLSRCLALLPERRVALFVLQGNENAVRFYESRGFAFTGHSLTQPVPGGSLTELEMVRERE